MKLLENLTYANSDAAQVLDVYLPDIAVSAVFVYFHGGGLDHGDKSVASKMGEYLAERGVAVVSANYRMYPEHKYPDFLYDAATVVAWAREYMKKELACDNLYVGGSSAGGYISMMLCFDKRYLASVGIDNSAISGYFHDAGQPTAHFNVLKFAGIDPRRIIVDESAPLYHIGTDSEYPPMRFIVSDNDMKNRYEQTMLVLSTMSHFGYQNYDHVVMNGKHCAYCRALDGEGVSVFGQMIEDFINSLKR